MVKGTKISFIPKKPLARKIKKTTRPVSALLFLSFGIFFIVIASYGALYLYKSNLKEVLNEKTKELETERKKADPSGIVEKSKKIQTKINNAKELLDKHVALSRMFDLLEELTLNNIVLNGLTLEKENIDTSNTDLTNEQAQNTDISNFIIKTTGVASSYASLAYQSDVLKNEVKENRRVKSFSISNPSLDESGNISFDLEVSVNPAVLLYEISKDIVSTTGGKIDENIVSVGTVVESQPEVNKITKNDELLLNTEKDSNEIDKEILEEKSKESGFFANIVNFFKKYLGK